MGRLLRNRVRCGTCRDEVESLHRHHFATCRCGRTSADGGKDYARRAFAEDGYEDLSVTEEEAIHGLALCAGIGGLEVGAGRALEGRLRCVGYVEREAYAAAALVARMDESCLDRAPVWDDLATFPCEVYRDRVDLVLAGFPCPPYSVAGNRLGASDPRDLWVHVLRVVVQTRAPLLLVENVRGAVSHPDGLGRWLQDLAGIGFDAEWECVSARDVGAPHRRDRVFLLAGLPDALAALREQPRWSRRQDGAYAAFLGDDREGVADPDSGRREGERQQEHAGLGRASGNLSDGRDLDRGFPWPPRRGDHAEWVEYVEAGGPEPALRGGPDGLPRGLDARARAARALIYRTDRLRALGNAVCPQQAEAAVRELLERR